MFALAHMALFVLPILCACRLCRVHCVKPASHSLLCWLMLCWADCFVCVVQDFAVRGGPAMFSIARIFEVMIATAFYSGLVYMFYDGTGQPLASAGA